MAPSLLDDPVPIHPISELSQTLFEGAEKKLMIRFVPKQNNMPMSSSLRNLSRMQVNSITDAAKCTILSVISSESVDAYLLSESSLFISDTELVIKTCGTTTLLNALATILDLADSVGMITTHLSFTRVAYLFPEQQPFPHNSFENEVSFLDDIFQYDPSSASSNRHVIRHSTSVSSEWYAYIMVFNSNEHRSYFDGDYDDTCSSSGSSDPIGNCDSRTTLEICMFDLDPCVMRQFMFNTDEDVIGPDRKIGGLTEKSGIQSFLINVDTIDAFNFDPCGYSMNALSLCGGYYTIHITPEDEASYVSFETNVQDAISVETVRSVIQTFKPGRVTVSLVSLQGEHFSENDRIPFGSNDEHITGEGGMHRAEVQATLFWDKITHILLANYDVISKPYVNTWFGCTATVTGISIVKRISPLHLKCCSESNNVVNEYAALDEVVSLCGAKVIGRDKNGYLDISSFLNGGDEDRESAQGKLFIDLSRITLNFVRLRQDLETWVLRDHRRSKRELRFSVGACFDKYLLGLLARFREVVFEVSDGVEIETLRSLGVSRGRLVLRTGVLMNDHLGLFGHVDAVVVHELPDEMTLVAMRDAEVFAECDAFGVGGIEDSKRVVNVVHDACLLYGVCLRVVMRHADTQQKEEPEMMHLVPEEVEQVIVYDMNDMVMEGATSLVLTVIGCRMRCTSVGEGCDEVVEHEVFLNDGVYGLLAAAAMKGQRTREEFAMIQPRNVGLPDDEEVHAGDKQLQEAKGLMKTTLWGPTCDSVDRIWHGEMRYVEPGESIAFDGKVGVYSMRYRSCFNGFGKAANHVYVTSC